MKWFYEPPLFEILFTVKGRKMKWNLFLLEESEAERSIKDWFPSAEITSAKRIDPEKQKRMVLKRGYEFI